MAIDDNTSYELTGYQVKDLASKIRAKADSNSLASVATSGLYSDLTGAPTIPTVYNGTLTIQQNGTTLGTFSANQDTNETINITGGGGATYTAGNGISIDANNEISIDDTVVAEVSDLPTDFTGATSSVAGSNGLVPAPAAGDENKVLKGDGTWQDGYDRVALYTGTAPADLTTPFYIYKDPSRQQPITWSEMRDLLKVSSNKEVVLWLNNSGDDIYPVIEYCDDSTEFYIVDPNETAYYYIQANYGDSTQTQFSIEPIDLQRKLTAGSNITISNGTISATDTTYSNFTGATSSVAGTNGLVPAPAAGDEAKALHGDGTWKDTTAKLVEMSYGESNAWAKFIAAYNAGSIVYCRASSNANPGTGSQTRKAFMAYVNNATSPTNVEFQYVRSQSSKTDSQQFDQVFVYTLTNASGGTWSVASRNMGPKINVDGPITKTFTTGANATITIGASAMTGATSGAAGTAGVVPAPAAGDNTKYLKGDGTWGTPTGTTVLEFYPVGSYYETSDTTFDPNVSWGGTWVEDTAGRVLVAVDSGTFSTVGGTGGEETHTLTTTEIPAHSHASNGWAAVADGSGSYITLGSMPGGATIYSTRNTGGGGAHNNLQPYTVVKRWHRTA